MGCESTQPLTLTNNFKSKLRDWIFTIQLATRSTCLSYQKTLSCDKVGVEIRIGWRIWRSSGETKLVSGGSIIIGLSLLRKDYGRL